MTSGSCTCAPRWYDPAIGRFISKDPVRGSVATPQSLNAYSYVGNNPCGLRDPSGEFFLPPSGPIGYELSPLPPLARVGAGAAAMAPIHAVNAGLSVTESLLRGVWDRLGPPECVLPPPPPLKPLKPLPPAPEFHDTGCRRIECMGPQFAEYWRWRAELDRWSVAALQVIRENGVTGVENIQRRFQWAKEAVQGIKECLAPDRNRPNEPPRRCPEGILVGVIALGSLGPIELGLVAATLAALAEPTPLAEALVIPVDLWFIYWHLQLVDLVLQSAQRPCAELTPTLVPFESSRHR